MERAVLAAPACSLKNIQNRSNLFPKPCSAAGPAVSYIAIVRLCPAVCMQVVDTSQKRCMLGWKEGL